MESWVEQLRIELINDKEIPNLNTLNKYEPLINEFFDELKSKNLVKGRCLPEVSKTLIKLTTVSNGAFELANSYHDLYSKDSGEIEYKEYIFKRLGFKTNRTHYLIAICNGYQVMSELLKKHLLLFINFDSIIYESNSKIQKLKAKIQKDNLKIQKLKTENQKNNEEIEKLKTAIQENTAKIQKLKAKIQKDTPKKSLGQLIDILKNNLFNGNEGKCQENKFVETLSVNARNSIAHYTYYFEDNVIHLCDSIFDNNPTTISTEEFRRECNELNILTQLLLIIYHDKYYHGGKLLLNGTV
jgi:hypothetical protein